MSALAGDLRFILLAIALGAFVMLLFTHALIARFYLARHPEVSVQKVTVALALWINLPMLLALLVWAMLTGMPSMGELAWAAAYDLIFFNCTAYAYFHVFNLSETGRRIRILLELLDGAAPDTAYAAQDMVRQRLVRLVQMGQVREHKGRYVLASRNLLNIARLIRLLGRSLTGVNRTRHAK